MQLKYDLTSNLHINTHQQLRVIRARDACNNLWDTKPRRDTTRNAQRRKDTRHILLRLTRTPQQNDSRELAIVQSVKHTEKGNFTCCFTCGVEEVRSFFVRPAAGKVRASFTRVDDMIFTCWYEQQGCILWGVPHAALYRCALPMRLLVAMMMVMGCSRSYTATLPMCVRIFRRICIEFCIRAASRPFIAPAWTRGSMEAWCIAFNTQKKICLVPYGARPVQPASGVLSVVCGFSVVHDQHLECMQMWLIIREDGTVAVLDLRIHIKIYWHFEI